MHPSILKIEQEMNVRNFTVPIIMSQRKEYRQNT